jgi:RHS repeat-associated protein
LVGSFNTLTLAISTDKPTYFDELDLQITQAQNNEIVQENHYYASGLSLTGTNYTQPNMPAHRFTYQGKELQSDFELEWYDFEARNFDPQIFRTPTIDPHAENYYPLSPYSWVANNPIMLIDPDGKDINLGNLYDRDKNGNLLYERQALAFELFLLTKTGKQFISDRAQKGFKFQGAFFKHLKFDIKEEDKLSRKINATFKATDLDSYALTKNIRYGAEGLTEKKFTKDNKLSITYHLDIDNATDNLVKNAKDWKNDKALSFVVLKTVDTWLHDFFLHGTSSEKDFLQGKFKNHIGEVPPEMGDRDHSRSFVEKSTYYSVAPPILKSLNITFKLGLSYEKKIWKEIIFHGYDD